MKKRLWQTIFGIYCAGMLFLLFFRAWPEGGRSYRENMLSLLNPVPFETIAHFIRLLGHRSGDLVRLAAVNLFGNVIMFIPLGFLLPVLFPRLRGFLRTMAVGCAAIVAVELTQMLTLLGTCDVDDLILNLAGIALGYPIYLLLKKKDAA